MALRFRLYVAGVIIRGGYYNFRVARAGRFVASRNRHGQYDKSLEFSIEGVAVTNLPFHLLQLLFSNCSASAY